MRAASRQVPRWYQVYARIAPTAFETAKESQIPGGPKSRPTGWEANQATGRRTTHRDASAMTAAVSVLPAPRKPPLYARVIAMNGKEAAT